MQYSSDDNLFLLQLQKQKFELENILPQLERELNSTQSELLQVNKMINILKLQIERNKKCQL